MTSACVLDASVVVAALLVEGREGAAAAEWLVRARVVAPALMPFEAASAVRRQERAGLVGAEAARDAVEVLSALAFESWAFGPLAPRVWELRSNVSAYDASYVALAELTDLPLVTLDRRLAAAPGPRCEVIVPA